jgi:hypothetical protein
MTKENELGRMWKEAVVVSYLWHYAGNFMEVPRGAMRNFIRSEKAISLVQITSFI